MTNIQFSKLDGAGNDFILIDCRGSRLELTTQQVAKLCHRRFGIGADGLMTLADADAPYHFAMNYYNSDGRLASMCGNGGRCIALFAHTLRLGESFSTANTLPDGLVNRLRFIGPDGPHVAELTRYDATNGTATIRLSMHDVQHGDVRRCLDGHFLDTGSPHYVQQVSDLDLYDVVGQGRRIRNIASEFPNGTNVDFVEPLPDGTLKVRTYERGVEDETWACGTGVTASALVSDCHHITTRGGSFYVSFNNTPQAFTDIWLMGPASINFNGTVNV